MILDTVIFQFAATVKDFAQKGSGEIDWNHIPWLVGYQRLGFCGLVVALIGFT